MGDELLLKGIPLFLQQFRALFLKNYLVARRSNRSLIIQLLSPVLFVALLFWALESPIGSTEKENRDPKPLISPPIPRCEDKYYAKKPCFDLLWSGNESSRFTSIVSAIMSNNPGRPIPLSKVKSFRTQKEVDEWLFNYPMHCPGALHFSLINNTIVKYGIQTNSTKVMKRKHYEDSTLKFLLPLQLAAEREIARSLVGDPNFRWVVSLKEFPRPAPPPLDKEDVADIKEGVAELSGPLFFLAAAMFGFVFKLTALVTEKELKLRQAMTMVGLYDSAYWLSWLLWETIVSFLNSFLTVACGVIFRIHFISKNIIIAFFVFFLFQLSMIAFSFMLSTFLKKASSCTTLGFLVFIISVPLQIPTLVGFPYESSKYHKYIIPWSLFPPNLLTRGLKMLISLSQSGMTFGQLFLKFLWTFFFWFLVALYLDNILPNSSGLRKSFFYFLNPGYWTGSDESGCCICFRRKAYPQEEQGTVPDDEDVFEEENLVKEQARLDSVDPNVAVQIRGLKKIYPGGINIGCCKCKKKKPFHAVKGLWMNIMKNQLFCLLGPNGAGKTTTIACLTGVASVTKGDALIYGESITSSIGMSNIRRMIGVCPQFDILWDILTGEEHLHLFASIKGLSASSIKMATEKLLAEVQLINSAKMRTGSYSGGMKRRISVAIALIGDPKLVILDEPTTGMDPITRRQVWDIIEETKKGRAVILTTHSMEEADVLSDRIGIMAMGRLFCIGTSIRLKLKYGFGIVANLTFHQIPNQEYDVVKENQDQVKLFFLRHLDILAKDEGKSFLSFIIPYEKEKLLKGFFVKLEDMKGEFGIEDIQLGLTTLEDVFLNISKMATAEAATVNGGQTLASLTLDSGLEILIPMGTRYIGIPGSRSAENPRGMMVEVHWAQDGSGSLCVSGHSPEKPIPPLNNLPDIDMVSGGGAGRNGRFGGDGPILGVVINGI